MCEYIAYHGTDTQNVKSIKANGFRSSTSYSEWLGSGVYFFVDGAFCPVTNARDWAISSAWDNTLRQNIYSKYSILMTLVSGDRALDLRKDDDLRIFETVRLHILDKYETEKDNFDERIHPDTFLCNSISKSLKLDILIQNIYIKNTKQRIKRQDSRIPNTTVLCAKTNAKIDIESLEVIETEGVSNE